MLPAPLTASERDLWRILEGLRGGDSILDFIPRVSPDLGGRGRVLRPYHLRPVADAIARARTEPVRICVSVPPRFAKTETILHGLAWLLMLDDEPETEIAYCTYAAELANQKSRSVQDICLRAGISMRSTRQPAAWWMTAGGVQFRAVGVGGPLTGSGAKYLVVDDPLKNREEAESKIMRNKLWEWFTSTALTRVAPNGSVIVVHCIAEGEPVLLADGSWLPVEQVRPGMMVASYDTYSKTFVKRECTNFRLAGQDPIYTIETERKSVRLNHKHPLLLESGAWCKASELKVGDSLTVLDEAYGSDTIDPELAWLFGYLMGDGWVTSWERKNKDKKRNKTYISRSWCVCVAAGIYPERNARAVAAFKKFFGQEPTFKPSERYYRLDNNHVGRCLEALGLKGGAWGKRIPKWVHTLNREGKIAYLRGYADADGHKLRKSADSWSVGSVSKDLIHDTQLLATSAAIRCGKLRQQTQVVKAPHSKEVKESTIYSLTLNFHATQERFEKIVKITIDEVPQNVYDLTVNGTENYITSGIVSRNTRWHDDDMIGRLMEGQAGDGWEFFSLPALIDENKPTERSLWPERWPVEELWVKRALMGGPKSYDWSSLFQSEPRPKGGRLFQTPGRIEVHKPTPNTWYVIGCDPAATEKTSSDYSAVVVLAVHGKPSNLMVNPAKADPGFGRHVPPPDEFSVDVVEVWREKASIPDLVKQLQKLGNQYNAPVCIEAVGGFKAVPQMLRQLDKNLRIFEVAPSTDKFTRSQPTAHAWNVGKIRVPIIAPWVNTFMAEVSKFTGVRDAYDDQVDALAYAFQAIQVAAPQFRGVKKPGWREI